MPWTGKASSACSAATGSSSARPLRTGIAQLRRCWEEVTIYNGDSVITPDVFVIAGRRVVDLSGITALDQATTIGRSELEGLPDEAAIAIIGVQGARGI